MASNYCTAYDSEYIESSRMEYHTSSEIYCVCRSSNIDTFMICCDFCEEWFHGDCIGVSEDSAEDIELYYCDRCTSTHPKLQITYRRKNANKRKSKKPAKSKTRIKYTPSRISFEDVIEEMDVVLPSSLNENSISVDDNQQTITKIPTDPRTMNDEALAMIFDSDTTSRKAKTVANKNIMDHNDVALKAPKYKTSPILRQCNGPECTKVARGHSKYCSDSCGIKLGTNRILEILPQRLEQRKLLPCTADDLSKKKLDAVRRKQKQLHSDIEQVNLKIVQLLQLVHKSKNSPDDLIVEDDLEDENSTQYCKLCGTEVQTKFLVRHMEHCYKKHERHLTMTDGDAMTQPDDLEWNIFCNHKVGRQGHCKQLRVLCPIHHRDRQRGEDEVCGFPFTMNLAECSGKFCGRLKKSCLSHPKNWEENFRADMDMQKLKFLMKLTELEREEMEIRRDMASRGNLMALLLNQTIVH